MKMGTFMALMMVLVEVEVRLRRVGEHAGDAGLVLLDLEVVVHAQVALGHRRRAL